MQASNVPVWTPPAETPPTRWPGVGPAASTAVAHAKIGVNVAVKTTATAPNVAQHAQAIVKTIHHHHPSDDVKALPIANSNSTNGATSAASNGGFVAYGGFAWDRDSVERDCVEWMRGLNPYVKLLLPQELLQLHAALHILLSRSLLSDASSSASSSPEQSVGDASDESLQQSPSSEGSNYDDDAFLPRSFYDLAPVRLTAPWQRPPYAYWNPGWSSRSAAWAASRQPVVSLPVRRASPVVHPQKKQRLEPVSDESSSGSDAERRYGDGERRYGPRRLSYVEVVQEQKTQWCRRGSLCLARRKGTCHRMHGEPHPQQLAHFKAQLKNNIPGAHILGHVRLPNHPALPD